MDRRGLKKNSEKGDLTFRSNMAKAASAAFEGLWSSPDLRTGEGARTLSFLLFWIFAHRSMSFII